MCRCATDMGTRSPPLSFLSGGPFFALQVVLVPFALYILYTVRPIYVASPLTMAVFVALAAVDHLSSPTTSKNFAALNKAGFSTPFLLWGMARNLAASHGSVLAVRYLFCDELTARFDLQLLLNVRAVPHCCSTGRTTNPCLLDATL